MTTLPRITPVNTPSLSKSFSTSQLYGAYPPKSLSNATDLLKIPTRINPLAPNPPKKRINMSWETVEQHWHNDKRRDLMQRREHHRYHTAWSKAFYGGPAEKELYRKHFRDVLKKQMVDKKELEKIQFNSKVVESERAVAYDDECKKKDAEDTMNKLQFLKQYRDSNKELMELKWSVVKEQKLSEDTRELEKLRYNPINWSCTLK